MKKEHLEEKQIQQYVLEKAHCEPAIVQHMAQCKHCQSKAAHYTLLFEEVKQQEKPVFDFNLADLVMEQLPKPEAKASYGSAFIFLIVFISIVSGCTVFYLFGNSLLSLFGSIQPILIGLIMTTVISLLAFVGIDMYRNYDTQMKTLNYY